MCPGIAEVREHAVAHVLGDVALEPGDHFGDARLVRVHHLAQVLRIEAGGELGRSDQVAEQERKLPPLWIARRIGGPRAAALVNASPALSSDIRKSAIALSSRLRSPSGTPSSFRSSSPSSGRMSKPMLCSSNARAY